jgi:hypothetical protein
MIKKIVNFQIKYAKILFLIFLILIFSGIYVAQNLKINPDFTVLIPDDSSYNVYNKIIEKSFQGDDSIVLYLSIDDNSTLKGIPKTLNTPLIDSYIDQLKQVINQSQYVISISEPIYSKDYSSLQIIILIDSPEKVGGLTEVKKELDYLINSVSTPFGVKKIITGLPIMLDKIPTLLIEDNLRTILITLVAIFLILYWYSRDFYFTFITIIIPIVSLIFLAAMMVFLNIDVTITLAAVGVLILGLGADYSIHLSIHYLKARKENETHKEALIETMESLILPISASFMTTLAGFTALMFGVSPSSQAQGIVLAIGITLIYLTTIILSPILITLFSNKINVKVNEIFNKILYLLGKLAIIQVRYSKAVIWIIFIITIFMLYGASKVEFSTSNSNWIPDSDPVSKSFREVVYDFGGDREYLDIILIANKGDLRNVQTMRDVKILESKLKNIYYVDSISSPYDNLNYNQVDIFNNLTYNDKLRKEFNDDWTLTRIRIVSRNPGRDDSGKTILLKEVRDIVNNSQVYGADLVVYGNAVRFDDLSNSLQRDTGVTTFIGLALVFLVTSIIYASFSVGYLSLLPIIIAVIWAVGLMGFFSVPFTSLSTGIISLVLGIGVDFSIHLVDSIKKYSRRMKFEKAVFKTMTTSGKAIFLSSLTTFVGFIALTFAQLLGTTRLGYSLAFSIVSVFLVSMILVPAVLSFLHKRNLKKLKNLEKI